MHEASIAASLLEIVSGQCRRSGYSRIESIHLKIGRASGIMTDALVFAFEALKEGSLAKEAVLEIEEVPVSGQCSDCNNAFTTEQEYIFNCPRCGGNSFRMTGGRELDIVDMEVS
jgi:hydrogenase nickel incorporation protein HypA/HybF